MNANDTWLFLIGGVGIAGFALLWQRRTAAVVARRLRQITIDHAGAKQVTGGNFDFLLIYGDADRAEIAAGLRAAGTISPRAITQFGMLRLLLTFGAGVAAFILSKITHHDQGIGKIYPYAAAAACFVLTKMLLRSRIAARQRRLGNELPFALDLLLLMLDSGVGIDHAFRQLAQTENSGVPALAPTFASMVDDIQCGMGYEGALDKWAENVNVYGARELASLFKQSLLYGTELSQAMRSFVHEFAERRVAMARESIGKKTAQMTVAMILFLMPALYICLCGPAVNSVFGMFQDLKK